MSITDNNTIDIINSNSISIDKLKTVCLMLGPYRNLTTLTASILFLHKNCQVLNHAGSRIFNDSRLDFLNEYSDSTFDTFVKYAIYISEHGRKGEYGGSITYSHAFNDKYKTKEIFKDTGLNLIKDKVECLLWKESLKTSHLIKSNNINLAKIFEKNEKLRFILPVRNPMDCALSNHQPKHLNLYNLAKKNSTLEQVLDAILNEILWVVTLKEKYPNRILIYFEHEPISILLMNITNFLNIENYADWNHDASKAFYNAKQYEHTNTFIDYYINRLEVRFSKYPSIYKKLLKFTQA